MSRFRSVVSCAWPASRIISGSRVSESCTDTAIGCAFRATLSGSVATNLPKAAFPPSREWKSIVRSSSIETPDLAFWKQNTSAASDGTACRTTAWDTARSPSEGCGFPEYNIFTPTQIAATRASRMQRQMIRLFLLTSHLTVR